MKNNFADLRKTALILGMLSTGALTLSGCNNMNHAQQNKKLSSEEELIIGGVEENETKVFEPGEHYISIRVNQEKNDPSDITTNVINNIPEGYEVYTIYPYERRVENASTTGGYEVWFVNNETVEVTSSYNKELKLYGFYNFGTVIEKTK